jgi:putative exosortase-associated protein (TIGR04073 family)
MCPICRRIQKEDVSYEDHASRTLARGALNAGLGWTELIRQPAKEARQGGNPVVGIAKGVGQGIARTFSGIGELLTFWAPKTDTGYIHFSKDCPLDATD